MVCYSFGYPVIVLNVCRLLCKLLSALFSRKVFTLTAHFVTLINFWLSVVWFRPLGLFLNRVPLVMIFLCFGARRDFIVRKTYLNHGFLCIQNHESRLQLRKSNVFLDAQVYADCNCFFRRSTMW